MWDGNIYLCVPFPGFIPIPYLLPILKNKQTKTILQQSRALEVPQGNSFSWLSTSVSSRAPLEQIRSYPLVGCSQPMLFSGFDSSLPRLGRLLSVPRFPHLCNRCGWYLTERAVLKQKWLHCWKFQQGLWGNETQSLLTKADPSEPASQRCLLLLRFLFCLNFVSSFHHLLF